MSSLIRSTTDAYLGLEDPTSEEWERWYEAMLKERAAATSGLDLSAYEDPATRWSNRAFRQVFLFMYDEGFFDREEGTYRAHQLVDRWTAMFGPVDSVLLWQGYPRIGFDSRSQFDFYRDMPGGLEKLRSDVVDVFHARGLRVFVDYNPWADPERAHELAEIVAALDVDGVMLDTMTETPEALEAIVRRAKPSIIFAPELRPRDADLGRLRQSWAQWSEVGDDGAPSLLRLRWLVPKHRQLSIRRWDTDRRAEIGYAFWNGSGLILWDNIFGSRNPIHREDRRLIAETGVVLDAYRELFVEGEWRPAIPTGVRGLDANEWSLGGATLVTLRNRGAEAVRWRPREGFASFWEEDVVVPPRGGVRAVVFDPNQERVTRAREAFRLASSAAGVEVPSYDLRSKPVPRRPRALVVGSAHEKRGLMVELPGAARYVMAIRHARRECGCYPDGITEGDATWGWFYKDTLQHTIETALDPFAIRATAVTNDAFLAFLEESRYEPRDEQRFLQHLRRPDGTLRGRGEVDSRTLALPVTFVSLDDARAFAAFNGEQLPTEAEWQWAAEGASRRRYPWGDEAREARGALAEAAELASATPEGVMGLSGNAWELTESERSDGHTRFVMLRGGSFMAPDPSEWVCARGPRPNDSHVKYILMADGLDRSEGVSFRTVTRSPLTINPGGR